MTVTTIFDTGVTMRCRMMSKKQRAVFLREHLKMKRRGWTELAQANSPIATNLQAKLLSLIHGKELCTKQSMQDVQLLYDTYRSEHDAMRISAMDEVPS